MSLQPATELPGVTELADRPSVLRGVDLRTAEVYVDHGILIKDCTSKSMPNADAYLRIASRTPTDNHRLIEALTDSQLAAR